MTFRIHYRNDDHEDHCLVDAMTKKDAIAAFLDDHPWIAADRVVRAVFVPG